MESSLINFDWHCTEAWCTLIQVQSSLIEMQSSLIGDRCNEKLIVVNGGRQLAAINEANWSLTTTTTSAPILKIFFEFGKIQI